MSGMCKGSASWRSFNVIFILGVAFIENNCFAYLRLFEYLDHS